MFRRFKTIIKMIWLRLWHPSVKTNGVHYVSTGTEILLASNGKLNIGRWVITSSRVSFSVLGGEMSIGYNSTFNRNDILVCRDRITIGNNCSFGPNVCIYDHDHKYDRNGTKNQGYKASPIIIGDNCWIGANAIILRGSHIGEGSVIGAGTIVKGNIPPHSVVMMDRRIFIKTIE